ncbi:MAG TPA: hypothetical protein VFA46_06625 [Actinomycetes bacterium]|nr:hypothetical protein [Actinomycetes bacterium]
MNTPDPEREGSAPPAVRRRSLRQRLRGPDSYGLLLLLILLSLLLVALVGEQRWGKAVVTTWSGATTLFAFWTSRPPARMLRWVTLGGTLSVLGASLTVLTGSGTAVESASRTVIALLTAASPVVVARRLLRHPRVQGATILGALCIYLLLGLFFAYLFSVVGVRQRPVLRRPAAGDHHGVPVLQLRVADHGGIW